MVKTLTRVDEKTLSTFKEGIFSLRTRRFGTLAELMVESLFNFLPSSSPAYDSIDPFTNNRIEVKFTLASITHQKSISRENVLEQCLAATSDRQVLSSEDSSATFSSKIQQIKPSEFDKLYYGVFFKDRIEIFVITDKDVKNIPNMSKHQHRGNSGEGQFSLTSETLEYHRRNHLVHIITYEDLYELFLPTEN